MKFSLLTFFAILPSIFGEVVKMDDSNFAELTKDKIVFIKFYAPWCAHCKASEQVNESTNKLQKRNRKIQSIVLTLLNETLNFNSESFYLIVAEDWIKLSEVIRDENVLIGEVDCSSEASEDTCDENDVEGFPSLKYGEGGSVLEEYFDERSFKDMYKFARENLKRMCSPKNFDLCTDQQKKTMDKYMAMSLDEVQKALTSLDEKLEEFEDAMDDEITELEEKYESLLTAANEKKKNAMKESDYAYAKQVLSIKTNGDSKDELQVI